MTIGVLAILAASLCAAQTQPVPVHFKTVDGWTIAAVYQAPKKGKPVAVLVHGVAAGKGEWNKLSGELWKLGLGTLAIDLRGHGDSTEGPQGKQDFKNFDATGEWPKAKEDILAALSYLKKKGIPASRAGLIGGSIGANLISQAASDTKDLRWLVLLSPGQDYRGVGIADLSGRKALVAASPGDAYAQQTAVSLTMAPGGPVFLQAKAGHGAQLIDDPEFVAKLLAWLAKNS